LHVPLNNGHGDFPALLDDDDEDLLQPEADVSNVAQDLSIDRLFPLIESDDDDDEDIIKSEKESNYRPLMDLKYRQI